MVSTQVIFSFVPYRQALYTLTAQIEYEIITGVGVAADFGSTAGLTTAIRKGGQNVLRNVLENSRENGVISLPAERIIAEGSWTPTQQRLLEVLQRKEYQFASIAKICQSAGYSGNMSWYQAMK